LKFLQRLILRVGQPNVTIGLAKRVADEFIGMWDRQALEQNGITQKKDCRICTYAQAQRENSYGGESRRTAPLAQSKA